MVRGGGGVIQVGYQPAGGYLTYWRQVGGLPGVHATPTGGEALL